MNPESRLRALAGSVALLLLAVVAAAHGADPAPAEAVQAEQKAALEAARGAAQRGPAELALGSQAKLHLPQGFVYIPAAQGGRLMRAMGNGVGEGFQGLVVPLLKDGAFSFYDLNFEASGYVKDDDAKNWQADELLKRIRDSTAAGNEERQKKGIPPIEITGWIEAPRYQADTHQLVWSVGIRQIGAPADHAGALNYRTLMLGREGYMAMTLVTDEAHLDELRPITATLLGALEFDDGKRYADFNSSTDRVAEIGLAALIAGVAAKKLGLLAIAVAFLVKFAKVIAIAVVGAGWWLRRRLGLARKSQAAAPVAAAPGAGGAAPDSPTAPDASGAGPAP